MNLKELKEIIKLMNENELTEIEIEREGSSVKLRKGCGVVQQVAAQPIVQQAAAPIAAQPVATPEATSPAKNSNNKEIVSPMVGTFYRSPSPESPSFIELGQIVEVGQVVCIVEAMKLMNEIKSEIKGKIVEAPVDNAQPIEFGQTLFVVEPV